MGIAFFYENSSIQNANLYAFWRWKRALVYQVGVISDQVHLYPAQRGHQETVVYVYRVYHIAARSLSMLSKADRFFLILLY